MIKRIDLFMPPLGQYGVLHHFTKKFYEALIRCGVDCRLLEAERRNPKPFLTKLFNNPPDCTLSFNGLLPDDEGRFFCDLVKIPHVACLVDSPNHFFQLIKSPYTIITCVDKFSCEFFRGMKHKNVLFMPHGIDKNIHYDPDNERTYDVLLPASYIDFEGISNRWQSKYPAHLRRAMHEAAELTLADQNTSYVQAFVQALSKHANGEAHQKLDTLDFVTLLDELEMYIRGLDRVRLVQSIPNVRIDIFGAGHTEAIWQHHLGKDHNVVLHKPVPFEEVIELMGHAKIVLNSCSWIKDGTHERLLASMACGAISLARQTAYLSQHFTDGKDILFYNGQDMEALDKTVEVLLKDDSKRQLIAKKGHDIVMHHHTWDHRAANLIRELGPMVEEIRATLN
jgi:spore maturation protein CgeB